MPDNKCLPPELSNAKFKDERIILAMVASILIHFSLFYFIKDNQPSMSPVLAETKRLTVSFVSQNPATIPVSEPNYKIAQTVLNTDEKLPHLLKRKKVEHQTQLKKVTQKKPEKSIIHQNQDKRLSVKHSETFRDLSIDSPLADLLMQAKSNVIETEANITIAKSNDVQEDKSIASLVSGRQDAHIILNPKFRSLPRPPVYPRVSIRRNQEGTSLIRAEISRFGDVKKLYIHQSSGYDSLDQAAMAAVRKWQFEPAKRDGFTTESWVQVPINFVLK